MSGDPMKLVKFMCANRAHNTTRSESALTIYEGVWAFCYAGGQTAGHDWKPVDGLPLNDAMRFAQPLPVAPAPNGTPIASAAAVKARKPSAGSPKDGKAGNR
jgi:hypothetical protein